MLVELLNKYLSAMTDIILRHRGNVNKYLGDGIMAIFGRLVETSIMPASPASLPWIHNLNLPSGANNGKPRDSRISAHVLASTPDCLWSAIWVRTPGWSTRSWEIP